MIIVLYEPEIPPNTGNIARMCAAFDVALHLVEPLGFSLSDRHLKRAGLDYWPHVRVCVWKNWQEFLSSRNCGQRLVMATTKARTALSEFVFKKNDVLVFGPETRGLPDNILSQSSCHIRIPIKRMQNGGVRSLNLSTACGIITYAALSSCNLLAGFD